MNTQNSIDFSTPFGGTKKNTAQNDAIKIDVPEKKEEKMIKQEHINILIPTATTVQNGFIEQEKQVNEILEKIKIIKKIENDQQNDNARSIATEANKLLKAIDARKTELNKPLLDAQKLNIEQAKKISVALQIQIDRVRNDITKFEQEKERKRNEEIRKLAEEKRIKDEAEKKEKDRIENIRNYINITKTDYPEKINQCKTSKTLIELIKKLNEWNPDKNFYQEFHDEIIIEKNNLIVLAESKLDILKQQEELNKKKSKLDEEEKERKRKELAEQQEKLKAETEAKKIEDEKRKVAEENDAYVALLTELTVLKVPFATDRIEQLKGIYGSYCGCVSNLEKIRVDIALQKESDIKSKQVSESKVKNSRQVVKFEIVDANAIPREYLTPDERKIREKVELFSSVLKKDINAFKIEGVKITIETLTVLK